MVEFANKCGILGELWINYKDDKQFGDFIEYNDLGLPLAYMMAEGLVKEITPLGEQYIEETFTLFIAGLEINENEVDEDFNLADLLDYVESKKKKK
jgi:hypothetical protein